MKKIVFISLVLLLSITLNAKNIDIQQAKTVAVNFLSQNCTIKSKINKISDITLALSYEGDSIEGESKNAPNILIYIFNVVEKPGFVIISGDDRVLPVLGYSNTGFINIENIPPALQKLIENID